MDKEMIIYIQKAAMYDAIINFVKSVDYVNKNDILAFAGELPEEENADA